MKISILIGLVFLCQITNAWICIDNPNLSEKKNYTTVEAWYKLNAENQSSMADSYRESLQPCDSKMQIGLVLAGVIIAELFETLVEWKDKLFKKKEVSESAEGKFSHKTNYPNDAPEKTKEG